MSDNVELNFTETFIIGGVTAVFSKTAAAPLERIKLLIQNQDEMLKSGALDKPYKGVIECTTRTFRTEGVIPFWRGNMANCIRYFPTQALNFAFKDKIKEMFHSSDQDHYSMKLGKNIASGGAAGGLSLLFVYSLDYARTRLGNDIKAVGGKEGSRQYSGLLDVYKQTLKTDGIQGLYRGFVISCVGIIVYRGCYFGFYDTLKPIMLGEKHNLLASFLLGYSITIASETTAYPFDTVRRRMMMTSGQAVKYKGAIDCTNQILKNEGVLSLFKGCGANILRGVAGAAVLVGFDEFKDIYVKLFPHVHHH